MSLSNTPDRYGLVSRALHWLTAGLILVLLPLGLIAEEWPYDTGAQLAVKAQLFSLHKTLGILVFFLALARLVWTALQPHPALLNGDRRIEARLAQTVHWLLYVALVGTPLTGWIHHAATEGFAPIWWPFGQSLPLVPKSESVSVLFSGLHLVFVLLLVATLGLHVAGALKHHLFDRDATLRRMLFGTRAPGQPDAEAPRVTAVAAVAVALVAIGLGAAAGLYEGETDAQETQALAAVESGWEVQEGTLAITVSQMGADVTGAFADWTASIDFTEEAVAGKHGTAEVTIAIGSLTLGSVTDKAMGPEYFDAGSFPTATFRADLLPADGEGQYLADGVLSLRGADVPVQMPFTLDISGDTAEMTATVTLDRRDFHIGDTQTDAKTLGFDVVVDIALTAQRS
ncbi:cytochrome b/b6 domain-containing protein [Tropicimonas isoalkanivorans]|uniref:Cytochrome b561 n=1 Tax=Tropicimonas isoalkanivorans TaxID=441112 RepID=A0A1I1E9Y8_9RHOB|nr:cytochrome b/b6 domain-containing protein [Tropicimonas isoalkanivorans]SFB83887.1 Cytochrome b561 [Tropicimonas isoalkanivorans]